MWMDILMLNHVKLKGYKYIHPHNTHLHVVHHVSLMASEVLQQYALFVVSACVYAWVFNHVTASMLAAWACNY